MTLDLQPYDTADYLTDDETISYYLIEALEENDVRIFAKALSHVIRAVGGVHAMAKRTALAEETLVAASSDEGDPDLSTILKVLAAFKVKVSASRGEMPTQPVLTAA